MNDKLLIADYFKKNDFKEMIYGKGIGENKILADGYYRDIRFLIVNVGGKYPSAYVRCDNGDKCDFLVDGKRRVHKTKLDFLERDNPNIKDLNEYFIGWKYDHYTDYYWDMGWYAPFAGELKKWTTEEIFEQIITVIDFMIDKGMII